MSHLTINVNTVKHVGHAVENVVNVVFNMADEGTERRRTDFAGKLSVADNVLHYM